MVHSRGLTVQEVQEDVAAEVRRVADRHLGLLIIGALLALEDADNGPQIVDQGAQEVLVLGIGALTGMTEAQEEDTTAHLRAGVVGGPTPHL